LLYFTAAGREAHQDPYYRHLYVVGFDGRSVKLLTPEAADHNFPAESNPALRDALNALGIFPAPSPRLFAPSGRHFIYNGPQVVTTPHDFEGAMSNWMASCAQSFAQLGFVAFVMDGRGTPMR